MSECWRRSAVALGSNLGERALHLAEAVREITWLEGVRNLRASRPIETDPVGGPPGQGRYLNAAVVFETSLGPRALLAELQAIEARHGRDRTSGVRHAPRTLDLDLLVLGDVVLDEDGLVLPHPRLAEREFVLRPLSAIAPELLVPRHDRSVRELFEALETRLGARRAGEGER